MGVKQKKTYRQADKFPRINRQAMIRTPAFTEKPNYYPILRHTPESDPLELKDANQFLCFLAMRYFSKFLLE